jgi:hypothetical protein
MIAVHSADAGASVRVTELWTLHYGVPLPKASYENATSSLAAAACAVTVTAGGCHCKVRRYCKSMTTRIG